VIPLPQHGGCICGDVRYAVREDPVTVYACHCTDCQTDSGSIGLLAVVVRSESIEFTARAPATCRLTLADGRDKGGYRCPRCQGPIGGLPTGTGIQSIDGGTFDDTSWIEPAGHIWVRSAQPWVRIPDDVVRIEQQPRDEDWLEMTRGWKQRAR